MQDDTLSIGIIGAGIMGERLLSAILDQSPPLVKVSGVWDPAPSAMERMATTFPQVPRLADAGAIIAASDCVYIASPPASHLDHARATIAAGKSVFCEKPLAVDVDEARAFVEAAADRGAVNFPFASSLAVATLMDWIAQGAVGTASRITVEVAFATCTSERSIEARLMAGDIPVDLTGSVGTTAKDDHNIWMLEGDRGAVRLCDWSVAERRRPDGTWERAADALSQVEARPIALRRQIEGVVRLTRGQPHHLATLDEALNVQEIVEATLAGGATAAG
ncbi:MAG: hypothetical protein B7Z14_05470 [Bosea sp. 32-68-6]|nr:MAG: hypothetical protein B7Z14_05470 [Bosea sp. 32-68-6]